MSDLSLDLLGLLSGAANSKDGYLRLLDRAREIAGADAAVVLRRHASRSGRELVVPLGRPLRREFAFATSVDRPDLVEGEVVRDAARLLFEGTGIGANLAIGEADKDCAATLRLEWADAGALALEPLQRLKRALPFAAPLIHSLRKYDSKVTIHPTVTDARVEDLDAALDTPDPRQLCRRAFGLIEEHVRLETALFYVKAAAEFALPPGGALGRLEAPPPDVLPRTREWSFAHAAVLDQKPVAAGEGAHLKRALALPCVFRGRTIAVVILVPAGRTKLGSETETYLAEAVARAALYVQKARLAAASRAVNPAQPLLLVGVTRDVLELAESYADADAPVLIKGETGTGKESIARFVHWIGPRRRGPFLPFNCAELVEHLAESQLFGHVKGSFTGATADTPGLFEQAAGGTLFLDEIHQLSPAMQAKFLRAVESGEVRPVGASQARRTDVRIVVATSQDLGARAAEGRFLPDLHMRLDVLELSLPPLRANRAAIGRLTDALLAESARRNRKDVHALTPRARQALLAYDYPGNVRELKNIIEKAVVTTRRPYLDLDALPRKLAGAKAEAAGPVDLFEPDYEAYKSATERAYLVRLLERAGGSVTEAARLSGLHRTHVYNLMRKHEISADRFKT